MHGSGHFPRGMSGAQRGFDTAENRRPRIHPVPAKPSPMPRTQSMDGADSPGAASPPRGHLNWAIPSG